MVHIVAASLYPLMTLGFHVALKYVYDTYIYIFFTNYSEGTLPFHTYQTFAVAGDECLTWGSNEAMDVIRNIWMRADAECVVFCSLLFYLTARPSPSSHSFTTSTRLCLANKLKAFGIEIKMCTVTTFVCMCVRWVLRHNTRTLLCNGMVRT